MRRWVVFLLLLPASLMAVLFARTAAEEDWFEAAFGSRLRDAAAQNAPKAKILNLIASANVVCLEDTCFLTADYSAYGSGFEPHFTWFLISDGDVFDISNDTSVYVYVPQNEGEYKIGVVMQDEGVEKGRDTLHLYITHRPQRYTVVPDSICLGMEATIGVDSSGPDWGGSNWAWSTGGTTRFINIRPMQAGLHMYPFRASLYPIGVVGYNNACYAEDSSWVMVYDTSQYAVKGPDGMCQGLSVRLEVEGGDRIKWNGVAGGETYDFVLHRDTVIFVQAYDRYGCPGTKYKRVSVIPQPDGDIIAYVDDEEMEDHVCLGRTLRLEAVSDVADRFRWFTRDTAQVIELIPKVNFNAYCDFYVGSTDECSLKVEKTILVENCNRVYFSSGFVLNGYSPTFGPIGIEDPARSYFFAVFDRNGTMVYSTTEFSKGWDGTYKGKLVPPGVYAYTFTERYEKMVWTRRGTVTVVQ